jgi:hypothetical protein
MFLYTCAQFILSEWIWSVTWDIYHIPFNIIVMLFLLKFFLKVDMVYAVCMAIFSQFFAFSIFSMCSFVAMCIVGGGGGPESYTVVPKPLYATLLLGALYSILQIVFFAWRYSHYKVSFSTLVALVIISNNLTVLITLLLFTVE